LNKEIRKALRIDRIIDIITIGAKSGLPRKKEIGFTNVNRRIIICGARAPHSPRDWFANLKTNSEFLFCLKQSLNVELHARAVLIVDPDDRRQLMSAPETQWYRDQVDSIEELVEGSPIVEVFFNNCAYQE